MPPQTPSKKGQNTISTATAESNNPEASARKRKSMATMTAASPESGNAKRIKTEKITSMEPKASKSATTASDSIYDVIIDFKVGESLTSFGIHRGLLRRTSSSFNEQLSASETTDGGVVAQCIVLKNEEPEVFRHFSIWLYSEKIISESETYKDLSWRMIIEVYSFAERNGIRSLQNTCIDTVVKKINDGGLFPGQADVNSLWKCTGDVFRLRRLLLDLFAAHCDLTNAMRNSGSYHAQFLRGLVETLYELKAKGTMDDSVDFWKKRKHYYVDDKKNPILLD